MPDSFHKKFKEKDFTALDNGIFRDARISLKARGLLCTAMSLPDDWNFSIRGLAAICKESVTAIQSALDELEQFGYLRRSRTQSHTEAGTFGHTDYSFFEVPEIAREEPCIQNPYTDEPYTENRVQEIIKQENIPPVSPEGEQPAAKPKKDKPTFPPDSIAYRCAAYLDRQIRERLPEKKAADERTLQAWADCFERCHRLDGYSWEIISAVLHFSQRDEFWSRNILSGRTFRAKFDKLYAKMQSPPRSAPKDERRAGYLPEVSDKW